MSVSTSTASARFRLDPTQPRAFVDSVTGALRQADISSVLINVDAVEYGDPALLAALQDVGEAARHCGKSLALEGVRPTLYKALHVARIAGLFNRVTSPPA